jgi:hypothetical protein
MAKMPKNALISNSGFTEHTALKDTLQVLQTTTTKKTFHECLRKISSFGEGLK